MSDYACIQCGMCCLVAPCDFSGVEDDDCPYLTINDDNTTTCNNEDAKEMYIGSGCHWQTPSWESIYSWYMEDYQIDERKQTLRRVYEQIPGKLERGYE